MTTPVFVWDRSYKNKEQVRPYFAAYSDVRAELIAAGKFPFNELFMGRIEGLAGSNDEETGVYLLSQMHDLDEIETNRAAFVAEGGEPLDRDALHAVPQRGTLVRWGWYMGRTGWARMEDIWVTVSEHGDVLVKSPRQRKWRHLSTAPHRCLFLAGKP